MTGVQTCALPISVELVGVDPEREPAADRFVRTVTRGRYLTPSDSGAIVVGRAVADRLAADLDDEILATAVGRTGDIESTMLRIVGIVDTGSDEIDAGICQVPLADIERLTGLAGAGEVAIVLKDWKASDTTRAALARSDRKSTRLNSSHIPLSRMPSSA